MIFFLHSPTSLSRFRNLDIWYRADIPDFSIWINQQRCKFSHSAFFGDHEIIFLRIKKGDFDYRALRQFVFLASLWYKFFYKVSCKLSSQTPPHIETAIYLQIQIIEYDFMSVSRSFHAIQSIYGHMKICSGVIKLLMDFKNCTS